MSTAAVTKTLFTPQAIGTMGIMVASASLAWRTFASAATPSADRASLAMTTREKIYWAGEANRMDIDLSRK